MGVDPMAIEVNGEQDEPDIHEPRAQAGRRRRAHRLRTTAAWSTTTIDPEVHAAEIALVEAHAKARLAAEVERVKAEAAGPDARRSWPARKPRPPPSANAP